MIHTLLPLSFRVTPEQRPTLLLPAIAFAATTALLLTLIGGAQTFWSVADADAINYQAAAVTALALLIAPLLTLGGAAARLSTRRRDDRLSTLRLLGVPASVVRRITVIESSAIALAGATVGVLGSFVLAPFIGLIPFRGTALGFAAVIPPAWVYAVVVAGVTVLAAVSAVLSLRQVSLSPLGVRTRQNAPRLSVLRVIAVIALLGAGLGTLGFLSDFETGAILATIGVIFGGTSAVLGLVGPWFLARRAARQARRAADPVRLLAARRVAEDPRAAWRQVSGVAMSSFMAVFVGSGVAVIGAMDMSQATADRLTFITDVRTGLIITVIGSFLIVACAVGVSQAADILDRQDLASSMVMLGADIEVVDAARRRAVMGPLLAVGIASAATAAVMVLPVAGLGLVLSPLTMIVVAAVLAAGIGIVRAGLHLTRGLQERVALAA